MDFSKDNLDFKDSDLIFDISKRGGVDLGNTKRLLKKKPVLRQFMTDFAINGFSSSKNFDVQIKNHKWSEFKHLFKFGKEAQADPSAITIKRALRVNAKFTQAYIQKNSPELVYKKYNKQVPDHLCFIGSHYICESKYAKGVLQLWRNFDSQKKTKSAPSVERVLSLRFIK